ncbi:MAG: glycosyltransferase [Candidatus Scalindua sp.]|nr:glycosyltransferase [Candidatus Scalindua sp.]
MKLHLPKIIVPKRARKVVFVGTYLPRKCGIGTFTYDLFHSISEEAVSGNCGVIAINDTQEGYAYPQDVVFEINQNDIQSYRVAAGYINLSGMDIVSVQHEFGIFGGEGGKNIDYLLGNLKKPVVTTLHTVNSFLESHYNASFLKVANLSTALVVMSNQAKEIVTQTYGVPENKIHVIPHGIPDVPFVDPSFYKDKFDVEGRFVILTFGLLSPNKGIEMVLNALPEVVKKHPKAAYLILGATHPNVKRLQGEEYRVSLLRLVKKLKLEQHVFFHNRFVELHELCEFIGACDIYITPYLQKEQIVSGTLAYAFGMGKAVISTPYRYAQEMLKDGCGKLVEFGDTASLSNVIIELMENDVERNKIRKNAYELGRNMIWREVARQYHNVFEKALSEYTISGRGRSLQKQFVEQNPIPEIKLDHLIRLTDDTGIIQHATFGIPNRSSGYSADDVARALVVVLHYYNQFQDEKVLPLAERYISFLHHAQLEDGRFHNFMNYKREFIDEVGSEDTWGRVLWAIGCAIYIRSNHQIQLLARELFAKAITNLEFTHPQALSYAILGFYYFLSKYEGATQEKRILQDMADKLVEFYEIHKREDWHWFSDTITYGYGKIIEALLLSYKTTDCEKYRETAFTCLDSLTEKLYKNEYFDFVGNKDWLKPDGKREYYDQQPIDAGYLVEAYLTAYDVSLDTKYLDLAQAAFEWFLGRNRSGESIYDFVTGGCNDGLGQHGVNLNQGAESIICFLLASLDIIKYETVKTLVE